MASEIVEEALAFYRTADSAYERQRKREKEDLSFQVPELAWPEEVARTRQAQSINGVPLPARPMISVASLDEPIQLVESQQRGAMLGVNIHPLTPDASDDTAEVLQDLYRQIEVDSRAHFARDWSFDRSLKCGRGCYEVLTEYDHDTGVPGDQKIVIRRLRDQSCVYLDPFAVEPDWSDGERALVVIDMPWTTYKRKYAKSDLASYTDEGLSEIGDDIEDWIGGDDEDSRTIRIGRYYWVEHETTTVDLPPGPDGKPRSVDDDTRIVHCSVINAIEELDSYIWGGQYIPLVPTIGRELQPFDGERRWVGMIANAKDAVRLTNYAASGAVEMAALEPKAPFQLDPEQIEGYESWWQQANTRNWPYLPSHSRVNGQPVEKPSRVQIDVGRLGPNMQLLSMGRDFVQSATQTYDPALGKQTSAHRSGRALVALQDQTVAATNVYISNLADISLTCEAKIILDAIPKYYDRPGRIVTLRDSEDKTRQAMLNAPHVIDPNTKRPIALPNESPQQQQMAGAQVADKNHPAKHYDLSKGRYGVTVTISKSYKSKLEQGNAEIGEIMGSNPAMVPLIGPIYFKYRDGPGMREIAKVLQKERDHVMPWLSDDAQQASAQQAQQLQAENQQLKQQLQQAGQIIQTKQVEQQGKLQITQVQEQAETARADKDREAKLAVAALGAKFETMQNAMDLLQSEIARIGSQQHEVGMAAMQHVADSQQGDLAHQQAMAQAQQQHGQALQQGDQQVAGQLAVQAAQPQPTNGSGE